MVFFKGCRGFLQELPWFYTRVAVVFSVIAKVKSTHSPRPKTGVRQKYAKQEKRNLPKFRGYPHFSYEGCPNVIFVSTFTLIILFIFHKIWA